MNWNYAIASAGEAAERAAIVLRGAVEDNLRRAAALGYDALEVHTRPDAALDLPGLKQIMADTGCRISTLVTGRLNTEMGASLLAEEPARVALAIDGMRRYIDLAAELKSDLILGWVHGNVPAGADREGCMEQLAERLIPLGAKAEQSGVRINLEVINRYETNVFNTAEETVSFLERYRVPGCWVHLDSFHMNIDEADPVAAIERCRGRLNYFHLADNSRVYPGCGTIDFAALLRALERIGYGGYLSVECFPWPSQEEAARRALQNMKAICRNLS